MISDELKRSVICGNCGEHITEEVDPPVGPRKPCPVCGSSNRKFEIDIGGEITPRSLFKFKARHQAGGKPFAWGTVGSDLYRKTGQWMRLERFFDRINDWYREHISVRESGVVVRHVEEPLSQHRGHGSARQSPKPEN